MASNRGNNTEIENTEILFTSVLRLISRRATPWVGTMTELDSAIRRIQRNNSLVIASSPSALRIVLNRVINRLRNAGVSVRFSRSPDKARNRLVKFSTSR